MITRRRSLAVRVGAVTVGGDAPISVQSMTKTATHDVAATVAQIRSLADSGCDIVRLAVPDPAAAEALAVIKRASPIPLVADIHFDHRLALGALSAGVDGLRLNPGNIRRRDHLASVVRSAQERGIPVRIGVNGGSVPHDYLAGQPLSARMVALAMEQVKTLEELEFRQIKISLKASDVMETVRAYRQLAALVPYPLHLGVTEAGPPITGAIRNALGIGLLLQEGIGDTLRVSLSGDPVLEVQAGKEILRSLHLAPPGPTVISCPTCGRTTLDVPGIATRISAVLDTVKRPVKVAIMGCVVNGPGECREADVGIAGGGDKVLVYRAGEFSHAVPVDEAYDALLREIERVVADAPAR